MSFRLASPGLLERWASELHGSVLAAVARQRAAMTATLAAHGLQWDSPAKSAPDGLWDASAWNHAVTVEVVPVAKRVVRECLAGMKAVVPAQARWGMHDPSEALVALVVDRVRRGGPGLSSALSTRPKAVTAAGGNLTSIGAALDDAADALGLLTSRSANQIVSGAQTVVVEAVNRNSEETVMQEWATMGDDRVREAHDKMDGQVRAADDLFEDGDGNLLRYPGDPEAPPETTDNCRCVLLVAGESSFVNVGPGGSQEAISDALDRAADA